MNNMDYLGELGWVWIALKNPACLLFFDGSHALFTRLATTDFSKFYFETGSHSIIHTFKNYFVIVFSVFSKSIIQTDP